MCGLLNVYEGAPAPVVGLMSTGPKAAALAVCCAYVRSERAEHFSLIRVFAAAYHDARECVSPWCRTTSNGCSHIVDARAAYLLVAFADSRNGARRLRCFYAPAYAAMNVAAFAVVSHFANVGSKYVTLEDYAGLGRRSPVFAATFTFFLMLFIGIPITGGFFAKFYVLSAALNSNLVGLGVILVLNSAVGAYYYLRIIVMMYMREPRGEVPVTPVPAAAGRGSPSPFACCLRFTWECCRDRYSIMPTNLLANL